VTWLEPELDDGAVPALSPLEPELLELFELELLELLDPDDVELELPVEVELDEWWVVAACAEPGRVKPMPAAASTLAAPAARVTVRSRDWWRSLAAIAASRWLSLAERVMVIPPGRVAWLVISMAGELLRTLCPSCKLCEDSSRRYRRPRTGH
jgi:hypothetical protein